MNRSWIGSVLLLLSVAGTAGGLGAWKYTSLEREAAAAASQPEPVEMVTAAVASEREHQRVTTSIGTVVALRSITLRNEEPGTVRRVMLSPGEIVEEGTVLVALDTTVEEAELKAQEAELALAETMLARVERASANNAVSEVEVDRARAERDVALAQIARLKAVIDRKVTVAPFRARIGLSDVHPGQYLEAGTMLTTLQGVDDAAHVDFSVSQHIAGSLREGETVEVVASDGAGGPPLIGRIVARDARIDQATRNAMFRARIEAGESAGLPAPGSSVRVRIPVGSARTAVAIPASALRKGAGGEHVYVIAPDAEGHDRVHVRSVESGAMVGDDVLIHRGLEAGDRVAATGSFKLREGVRVAVPEVPERTETMAVKAEAP